MTEFRASSSGRWRAVQAHFLGALDAVHAEGLTGAAAAALAGTYANAQCGSDRLLLQEVLALLAAHFGDGPVPRRDDDGGSPQEALAPGDTVADFSVVGRLGAGGMGVVYLAERQRDGFVQRVALKVLPAGGVSPRLADRLAVERGILARLEHPGIARFIDGGTTADGRPYIAMEYVDGLTLMEHCAREHCTLEERLRLFLDVCDAVHAAHQQLVVHRDLKPGNVMVTADGRTRLLDFGIAKVLEEAGPSTGGARPVTMPWFTPGYAAPEQLRGEPASTLTDVYQLGLTLYELLTGQRPFESHELPPLELQRVVCEEMPVPPSRRMERASCVARRRRRRISAELDAITMRALAKEPAQRYTSAQQLAADVRRYLDRRPVSAVRATRGIGYPVWKFARRHAGLVVMAVVLLVTLGAGVAATAAQARSAARARDAARAALGREERARDRAREELAFLLELFGPEASGRAPADDAALRLLSRGVERAHELPDDWQRAARLDVLGRAYETVGAFARAEALLRESLALRLAAVGELNEEVASTRVALGTLLRRTGHYVEAESMYVAALRTRERLRGAEHPEVAQTLTSLAGVALMRGRGSDAIAMQQRALGISLAALGSDHPEAVSSLERLGALHRASGSVTEAERIYREVLARRRATHAGGHPLVASALLQLAQVLHSVHGRTDEAEPLYLEALDMQRQLYGPRHPNTVWGLHALAQLRASRGELAQALELVHEARAIREEAWGPRHPSVTDCLWLEGSLLRQAGDHRAAAHVFEQVLERQIDAFGTAHLSVAATQAVLGGLRLRLDDVAAAEALIRESLRTRRALLPATDPLVTAAESLYLRVAQRRVAGR